MKKKLLVVAVLVGLGVYWVTEQVSGLDDIVWDIGR